ncbi:MAG: MBL fold metallo-hydrolase [Acetivibrionales bacterium]|jgi:ribonuclease BN (tRNA processing enzyme)
MKLTILGNNGPFPSAGGACSGYLVRSGSANILVDCGNGTLANLQKVIGIGELDAVILTHLHSDHTSDLHVLRYAVQIKRMRGQFDRLINVYAPSEPAEEYARFDAGDAFVLEAIEPGRTLLIGDVEISFGQMKHPYLNYAVKMKCEGRIFVYSGDTSWTENLVEFAKGADLLMLDAGLLEKDYTENAAHLTAGQCGLAASEAGAGKLLLTHLWPEYDLSDIVEEARRNFENAETTRILQEYEV